MIQDILYMNGYGLYVWSSFIFTLSCPDTSGIVAEVAGFMAKSNLTIKESNQFGDSETNSFFMRVKALSINGNDKINIDDIRNNFKLIAKKRKMEFNIYNANEVPKIIIMVSKFDHCLVDLLYRVKIGELKGTIKECRMFTLDFISKMYDYENGIVQFKPTKA